MAITRRIAAAAMLTGVAVGTAITAWADTTMNGHYNQTLTNATGQTTTNDWQVTPCGDGCASIVSNGKPLGQARLANGQWTMDATGNARCNDGTSVASGIQAHYVWDANTLTGTGTATLKPGVCPADTARTGPFNIQLTQAP
jgi:hypothetical protein